MSQKEGVLPAVKAVGCTCVRVGQTRDAGVPQLVPYNLPSPSSALAPGQLAPRRCRRGQHKG